MIIDFISLYNRESIYSKWENEYLPDDGRKYWDEVQEIVLISRNSVDESLYLCKNKIIPK